MVSKDSKASKGPGKDSKDSGPFYDYIVESLWPLAVPLESCHMDPVNARTGHAVDRIAGSLKQYKQRKPIVVNRSENGKIEAGNGTWLAARRLGWTHIAVVYVEDDPMTAAGYGLADNRLGELSTWDAENLMMTYEALDPDVLTGFTADAMEETLATLNERIDDAREGAGLSGDPGAEPDPETPETEAAQLALKWGTAPGQLWQVGRHRLACIDALDPERVAGFLDGAQPRFIWADPPYGIEIVGGGFVGGGEKYDIPFGGRRRQNGENGKAAAERPRAGHVGGGKLAEVTKYAPVVGDGSTETARAAVALALATWPEAVMVFWGANYYADACPGSACWLIWDKNNTGHFADAEMAWTNQPTAARIFRHTWNGMIRDSERGQRRLHPTQKPVALAAWAFEKYGQAGDVIFDPFTGSGISLLAAERLDDGRTVYAAEITPEYVAVTLERFKLMTGREAKLIDTWPTEPTEPAEPATIKEPVTDG